MILNELHILPTQKTPEVLLSSEGLIIVKGRDLRSVKEELPVEIKSWIDNYIEDPAEITNVLIAFEYLNSGSTGLIIDMLKNISKVLLRSGKKLNIRWYYEVDDLDILERGEFIAGSLDLPIEFISVNDVYSI